VFKKAKTFTNTRTINTIFNYFAFGKLLIFEVCWPI